MVEQPANDPGLESAVAAAVGAVDAGEVVRIARALIAAPSENPGGTEEEAAQVAAEVLAGLDAEPRIIRSDEDRPSVLAAVGSAARPSLAWNGHLDVVPAGAVETWPHPPWDGVIESGRLIGRGACDMKGPIAAALAAGAAIQRAGVELGGTLHYHLAADEEVGGIHGTKVMWDRGLIDQDACIVGEPTELQLGLAERGGAWFTVITSGTAAHGSQPQRGVNAITSMARFVLRANEVLPDRRHPLVGSPTVNVALIEGGHAPNAVPDRCVADVDRRVIPGETFEEVEAGFTELMARLRAEHPDVRIEASCREWTLPAEAAPDTPIAELCRAAVKQERGAEPADVGFTGITDARFYINDGSIPTVILGPGSLADAHTAGESVDVDDLVAAARIYARVFVRFLGA
ncbi:MAG: M20 family metallopeptidase [Actinomycetota bacterium]|nr:M20 family metallopeptidase [Actinomycetota bacterium]